MSISFVKNKFFQIFILIFMVLVLIWGWVLAEEKQEFLEVNFYDVGQGDAIFIETPAKEQVLIDGGPDLTILEKLGKELPFWDRYIDLVVLTHPEADHISGLIEVIKRYKIGGILTTGVVRDTAEYKEWKKIIKEKNIPIYIAKAGGIINLDNGIKLFVLHPFENLDGQKIKKTNNTCVVNQLVYKDFELLLTGDIEKKAEEELVNSGINLESDVLKVPHHGSKTSSSKEFLEAVKPKVAVIQVGRENHYGHPHTEALKRLGRFAQIFRTDQDGDIKLLTSGIEFKIQQPKTSHQQY